MEQGWDPEVTKYFRRIINTIAIGLCWMMAMLTAGLYYGLAFHDNLIVRVAFFLGLFITLYLVIRYVRRLWRN